MSPLKEEGVSMEVRGERGGKGGWLEEGRREWKERAKGGAYVDARAGGGDDGHEKRELGCGVSGCFISSFWERPGGM